MCVCVHMCVHFPIMTLILCTLCVFEPTTNDSFIIYCALCCTLSAGLTLFACAVSLRAMSLCNVKSEFCLCDGVS